MRSDKECFNVLYTSALAFDTPCRSPSIVCIGIVALITFLLTPGLFCGVTYLSLNKMIQNKQIVLNIYI